MPPAMCSTTTATNCPSEPSPQPLSSATWTIPDAKRFDGLAAMLHPPATPIAMGKRVDSVAAGEPASAFARTGAPVDADGQIGTPGEWNAELPDVESMPRRRRRGLLRVHRAAALRRPFTSELSTAQARGAGRRGRVGMQVVVRPAQITARC